MPTLIRGASDTAGSLGRYVVRVLAMFGCSLLIASFGQDLSCEILMAEPSKLEYQRPIFQPPTLQVLVAFRRAKERSKRSASKKPPRKRLKETYSRRYTNATLFTRTLFARVAYIRVIDNATHVRCDVRVLSFFIIP